MLSKFQRAYMRAGTAFESSLEQHQLILSWHQIRPVFARDRMAGFRPRPELQNIDYNRNTDRRRYRGRCWPHNRGANLFDDTVRCMSLLEEQLRLALGIRSERSPPRQLAQSIALA